MFSLQFLRPCLPPLRGKQPEPDADDVSRLWGKARGEGAGQASGGAGRRDAGEEDGQRRCVVTGLPENADDNELKMARGSTAAPSLRMLPSQPQLSSQLAVAAALACAP